MRIFITSNSKGFTLIELLVVISIIGVLSSVVLASLNSARVRGRNALRLQQVRQIVNAMSLYMSDNNGQFPSSSGSWRCLGHGDTGSCWAGLNFTGSTALDTSLQSYMSKIPDDPANITTCYGDAYLYNSNIQYPNPPAPAGAYLLWYHEGDNPMCGPGMLRAAPNFPSGGENCASKYACYIYLGANN